MLDILFIEARGGARFHYIVPLNGYRQSTSFNAFMWGKRKTWNKKPGSQFFARPLSEHKMFLEHDCPSAKWNEQNMAKSPPVRCVDLWDFYSKIGYNLKTGKFE